MAKIKNKIRSLGIMNGTSVDAIDYSLIEASSDLKSLKFIGHFQKKIPTNIKSQLIAAADNKLKTYEVSQLHFDLGRLYAKQVNSLKSKLRFDIIGVHGQTVHHEGKIASLQIGHPASLFQTTNRPVFFDFRSADIAAGGEGAPFAPFFQNTIAKNSGSKNMAFHNLGGISNLTYIQPKTIAGFDTGPANILLDKWMFKKKKLDFDKGGKTAEQGLPNPLFVNRFLEHPYFSKKAPKSTGREDFNLNFIESYGGIAFKRLSFNDQMATLTEVSALSIAQAYQSMKTLPDKIYFYGGGVFNKYLMERIQFNLPDTEILKTDDLGWPSQAFESSAFAFLAAARYFNKKVHLPKVTGAKSSQHLGSVYGL